MTADEYNNQHNKEQLLSVKEVAYALGRNVSYIYRMRKLGLKMPGGRITLGEVKAFLEKNPVPWQNYRKKHNSTKKR